LSNTARGTGRLHRALDPFVWQMFSQPAQIGRLLCFEQQSQVTGEHGAEKLKARRFVYNYFQLQKQNAVQSLN
jgi:hypothetical protein